MSANEIQYYDMSLQQSERPNDFAKLGHPGKWYKSIPYGASSTLNFTGSNFGVGAIIMTNTSNTLIHLSDGGNISGSALNANEIHELSIKKIETGASAAGYVLIRNQMIR